MQKERERLAELETAHTQLTEQRERIARVCNGAVEPSPTTLTKFNT